MKLSALLAPLVAAKADHETIMQVVLAYETEQSNALEHRREADRERQARKRSRDVTLGHSDRSLTGASVTHVEDKPLTQKIEPQQKEQKETPRSRLSAVLDEDRAGAVIEHRHRLRKPLTEHAAKLLAEKFRACPDPNAAADRMIESGWLKVEPEWLDRPTARGSPPAKSAGMQGVLRELRETANGRNFDQGGGAVGAPLLSVPYRRAN